MIRVNNLVKNYGERVAVNNISFSVERGEILGFLGQNGAGKTTTMKVITGFMAATSGQVSVAGFDVFENPIEVKKRIGFLPEVPPLYPELLVSEYLDFVADMRGIPKHEKKNKIDIALSRCQLGDVKGRLIGNLSKGYRQRVGIAQAIVHDPEVLILDEPTIGLDPKQVAETRSLIRSFSGNKTVIFSTHILSEVAATCDRIVVIDNGILVGQERITSKAGIGTTIKTEVVVQSLSERVVEELKRISGIKEVKTSSNGSNKLIVESDADESIMTEIAKTVVRENAGLIRMAPVLMALEEYYLDLIKGTKRSVQ